MAYQRSEYHREVQRDEDRDNKQGGWKSWFGLGGSDNKDEERERDRGYSYSNTTTYRNPQPSYGYPTSERYPERGGSYISGGYSGARGGYGYTTSDEVNRGGPSWANDRDYTTRGGYGTTSGERDIHYKQETRTYGDRDNYPSRSYGYEHRPASRGIFAGGPSGNTSDYNNRHPWTGCDRDNICSTRYPVTGDRDYSYKQETRTYGGDSNYNGANSSRYPNGNDYNTPFSSRPYTGDYNTPNRYGFSGDRYESRGYNYGGDRDYQRPSYQDNTYRRY